MMCLIEWVHVNFNTHEVPQNLLMFRLWISTWNFVKTLLKPWAYEERPLQRTKTDLCLGFRVLGLLHLIWVHKTVTKVMHAVLEISCPGIWRVPFLHCKYVCRFFRESWCLHCNLRWMRVAANKHRSHHLVWFLLVIYVLLGVGFRAWSGTQFRLVPPPQFTPQSLLPIPTCVNMAG